MSGGLVLGSHSCLKACDYLHKGRHPRVSTHRATRQLIRSMRGSRDSCASPLFGTQPPRSISRKANSQQSRRNTCFRNRACGPRERLILMSLISQGTASPLPSQSATAGRAWQSDPLEIPPLSSPFPSPRQRLRHRTAFPPQLF